MDNPEFYPKREAKKEEKTPENRNNPSEAPYIPIKPHVYHTHQQNKTPDPFQEYTPYHQINSKEEQSRIDDKWSEEHHLEHRVSGSNHKSDNRERERVTRQNRERQYDPNYSEAKRIMPKEENPEDNRIVEKQRFKPLIPKISDDKRRVPVPGPNERPKDKYLLLPNNKLRVYVEPDNKSDKSIIVFMVILVLFVVIADLVIFYYINNKVSNNLPDESINEQSTLAKLTGFFMKDNTSKDEPIADNTTKTITNTPIKTTPNISIKITTPVVTTQENNNTNETIKQDNTPVIPKVIRKHNPVNLGPGEILVSFRIDNITFSKEQKPILENALALARKYNITFDLGVVAIPFDSMKDNETYRIYLENPDVFEIIANGHTGLNVNSPEWKGEFYDMKSRMPVDADLQDAKIYQMKAIFDKYKLDLGTKIFAVPWNQGDYNTIKNAEKHGYKLIIQVPIENTTFETNNGKIIASRAFIEIKPSKELTAENILSYDESLNNMIKFNAKYIIIAFNRINFEDSQATKSSETLILHIMEKNKYNNQIKISMISDRFFN